MNFVAAGQPSAGSQAELERVRTSQPPCHLRYRALPAVVKVATNSLLAQATEPSLQPRLGCALKLGPSFFISAPESRLGGRLWANFPHSFAVLQQTLCCNVRLPIRRPCWYWSIAPGSELEARASLEIEREGPPGQQSRRPRSPRIQPGK